MYKKLIKDSAIYGLGAIFIKSLAFLTLPIYTRIFSPEEFGAIEMFSTIGGILSIVMTMGLDTVQSFYFMEAKNNNTRKIEEVTTSIVTLRILIGVIFIGLTCAISPFLLDFAFDTKMPAMYLLLVALSIFFGNLISQSLEIFRLSYKPWQYISLSFVQTVANIGLVLYLTYVLKMGIYGYFLGMTVSSALVMIAGWIATRKYRDFKSINAGLWWDFLKFGLPLVPAGLSIWLMQAGDRWFIMKMLGSHELGIYAVGAKISMILILAIGIFRQAWWPIATDMIHKPEGNEFIRRISLWYIVAGSSGAVFLTLISPHLVKLLTTEEYYESYKLVGVLSWGGILYGFYLISELGVFKSTKTYLSVFTNSIGALLNIILTYFLISWIGVIGAAYATVFSMIVANLISMKISNKYLLVKWNWGWLGLCTLASLTIITCLSF